ncbi:CTSF family protein [Megaselia abdita]
MAMANLPVTINFVNIIEAFREIVNGVRYELLVNAVNTTEKSEDKDLICRLVVLEQPWLVTIWGDKVRLLKYSNCSDTEADQASQDSINQIYKTNTIFDGSAIGEDEDGLKRIEAQIIQPKEKVVAFKESTPSTSTTSTLAPIVVAEETEGEDVETTTEELSDDSKKWLDGFFGIFESPTKQTEIKSSAENAVAEESSALEASTTNNEIEQNAESRAKRDVLVGGNTVLSENDANKLLTKTFAVIATGEGNPDIKVKKVNSAQSQVVSGILYKINGDFVINDEEKSNCDVKVWERPWLGESGGETDISCPDGHKKKYHHKVAKRSIGGSPPGAAKDITNEEAFEMANKVFKSLATGDNSITVTKVLLATKQTVAGINYNFKVNVIQNGAEKTNCVLNIYTRPWEQGDNSETSLSCPGEEKITTKHRIAKRSADFGAEILSKEEAKQDLEDAFSFNQEPTYQVSKINSAFSQLVNGKVRKINADLITPNHRILTCDITLHDQPWVHHQGLHVTVNCPGEEEIQYSITAKHYRLFNVEDNFPHHRHVAEKKDQKKTFHQVMDKTEHQFNKFQLEHGKVYYTAREKQMRLTIFKRNLQLIEDLNRYEQGTAKYGITEFADLTMDEFRQRTGLVRDIGDDNTITNPTAEIPDVEIPKSFDWREKNVVSPVKDQGQCGSCWAFSVTGNIEGLHAIKSGKLEEYSEQELLDCDTVDGACGGGDMDKAYTQIEKIGGLELESDYPYKAKKDQCHFDKSLVHVKVKGAVDLPKNETAMAQWLVTNGPISIGLNANAMQFYRGGISHPWKYLCRASSLDHGVLIVGLGVSEYPTLNKTLPYWIVKNSWGKKWGEQGYYRIYRGENTCGVREMATSAVLAD